MSEKKTKTTSKDLVKLPEPGKNLPAVKNKSKDLIPTDP